MIFLSVNGFSKELPAWPLVRMHNVSFILGTGAGRLHKLTCGAMKFNFFRSFMIVHYEKGRYPAGGAGFFSA